MDQRPLRRDAAAVYLRETYGIPITPNGLAKLAVRGDSPPMTYFNRTPLYPVAGLDEWAKAKLSAPVVSTAGRRALQVAA